MDELRRQNDDLEEDIRDQSLQIQQLKDTNEHEKS